MRTTLRAVQLGITPEAVLKNAIENRGDGLDIEAALKAVSERLPRFGGAFATAGETL